MRACTDSDIAWVAGIVEGEGCITRPRAAGRRWRIYVEMSDADVVRRLQRITGVGTISTRSRLSPGGKQMHAWQVCVKRDVADLLRALFRWFGERRRLKAVAALKGE